MIGAAESIKLIADGSLISSPCFQKYLNSGDITQLSATNETLQVEQINNVQVQFGANPYDTVADSNTTVTTAQTYEPDVLGVSKHSTIKSNTDNLMYNQFVFSAFFLDFLLCCFL